MAYRYRCNVGSTWRARKAFCHLPKIGVPLVIRGYRYRSTRKWTHRPICWEVVMAKGTLGTARFSGLCWGYGGTGPCGLRDLLMLAGVPKPLAEDVAFRAHRPIDQIIQTDWEIQYGKCGWARTT